MKDFKIRNKQLLKKYRLTEKYHVEMKICQVVDRCVVDGQCRKRRKS